MVLQFDFCLILARQFGLLHSVLTMDGKDVQIPDFVPCCGRIFDVFNILC